MKLLLPKFEVDRFGRKKVIDEKSHLGGYFLMKFWLKS